MKRAPTTPGADPGCCQVDRLLRAARGLEDKARRMSARGAFVESLYAEAASLRRYAEGLR